MLAEQISSVRKYIFYMKERKGVGGKTKEGNKTKKIANDKRLLR